MSDDFNKFKERTKPKSPPTKPKKQSNSVETPKRSATPYINKSNLKNELRQLIDTVGSGHKKYTLLGYENILQVKGRIWKIIDLL